MASRAMVLLNVSNTHLFWKGREPQRLEGLHAPNLLAFPQDPAEPIADARARLDKLIADAAGADTSEDDLAKAASVGEAIEYRSFWNHGARRMAIPVAAKRPYWVPDISDRLFFDHGFYTCEHDIPYIERALADLNAEHDWWLWDTKGQKERLSVLTYDIETTQYGTGAKDIPIDVIGHADFDVVYEASKDLASEKFDFRFHDLPQDWADREVVQLVARTRDEELDNLHAFTKKAVQHDIIAGHNVLGFDNKQIHERIVDALRRDQREQNLSPEMRSWFETFTSKHSRPDRSFHFGTSSDIAVWYPSTLDTYHAARKFFFFHDDFTLKGLAPWLGIEVEGRVYVEADQMKLDDTTLRYNVHDIQEQLGITQKLIAQALPLSFTTDLPMESLLTGGNTKMWDHMAFVRARRERKFMPATCRAQGAARGVHRLLRDVRFPKREQIAEALRELPPAERDGSGMKEFIRVVKQGPEMPFWMEHPGVVVQPDGSGQGYAIAGGLTLNPVSDLHSHFVPWYHVVEADVGAMYPTLLKARNLTADTVRPATTDEVPDDWLWLRRLDDDFVRSGRFHVRPADAERESYTKGKGWMVGMVHASDDGLVNKAMTGILDMIQIVKDERAAAKTSGDPDRLRILDMTYASLKAARNAGTHGILVAVNVSCRQFNVWGGANITTIGQRILQETLQDFEAKGIRVVYGDTDGIYLGCSKSVGNLPHLAEAIGSDADPDEAAWITMPDDAIEAVQHANQKWREELDYEGFELEAEQYDAMVYIVHKNYLKFSARDGTFQMETKGNNFKGSDKAPLARRLLGDIMQQALHDVDRWTEEEDARERMKTAIKRATKDVMGGFKANEATDADIVLRQQVQPVRSYKANPDGSLSGFAVRTVALEQVLGEPITASRKFRFVICKDPLPLYRDPTAQHEARERLARQGFNLVVKKPKKSGIKPIEYMWPVDQVKPQDVDWVWYKDMVENYVKGAFGFDSLELAVQRDLSSWF